MGLYRQALEIAAADHTVPDIVADDKPGRQKHGYGLNLEQPIADDGDTGAFLRWGWNDGNEESFAFTEVDRSLSFGGQLSGNTGGGPMIVLASLWPVRAWTRRTSSTWPPAVQAFCSAMGI